MSKKDLLVLAICFMFMLNFTNIGAKTKIVIPPDSTDIIVCTTDKNGVTVCL